MSSLSAGFIIRIHLSLTHRHRWFASGSQWFRRFTDIRLTTPMPNRSNRWNIYLKRVQRNARRTDRTVCTLDPRIAILERSSEEHSLPVCKRHVFCTCYTLLQKYWDTCLFNIWCKRRDAHTRLVLKNTITKATR